MYPRISLLPFYGSFLSLFCVFYGMTTNWEAVFNQYDAFYNAFCNLYTCVLSVFYKYMLAKHLHSVNYIISKSLSSEDSTLQVLSSSACIKHSDYFYQHNYLILNLDFICHFLSQPPNYLYSLEFGGFF